ncbi:hypothetical protein Tco_0975957 [Tanacetum coccineum]|uniref:Uncharacterized protein n=1 Tax=Tanacetum coccineum TaxID=301880 RepID=A0ABQ5EFW0_9ASTR
MSDKKTIQSNPPTPEKPTEAILQPKQSPNSETHRDGSSSDQHTHQPTSPITVKFLTKKEYQQLLLHEEVLREILEEQARVEKEWEERVKKEQAEDELFRWRSKRAGNSRAVGLVSLAKLPKSGVTLAKTTTTPEIL